MPCSVAVALLLITAIVTKNHSFLGWVRRLPACPCASPAREKGRSTKLYFHFVHSCAEVTLHISQFWNIFNYVEFLPQHQINIRKTHLQILHFTHYKERNFLQRWYFGQPCLRVNTHCVGCVHARTGWPKFKTVWRSTMPFTKNLTQLV